ncbi:AP-1-like transcription factor [Penicillium chrysogenum]|uniref:AP-1-like transcription factor n=1 Tax=Penicillium chrysogenum TaxID=5076 RepID=A0A167SX12_PENCH|nr:DNA-binding transcription factor yap1 [Penicillium rubens]KZN87638.1 AP-1-like transcription factor [Penicillium chrysogenum]
MDNYNQLHQERIHLSPCRQDLLLGALSGTPSQKSKNGLSQANFEQHILPGHASSQNFTSPHWCSLDNIQLHENTFGCSDDGSSLLDYKSAADFELPGSVDLTGNLPGSTPDTDNNELDEKQKSTDGTVKIHNKETKKKQGESRAKIHDKKPLDSESITKRRAQNRAAQRAFRERKEKHSQGLETRAEELKKSFDLTTQENSLLWAQIKRLQVEIRETRKRL